MPLTSNSSPVSGSVPPSRDEVAGAEPVLEDVAVAVARAVSGRHRALIAGSELHWAFVERVVELGAVRPVYCWPAKLPV